MKLRNLFFATIAVCTFAACSNEEESINSAAPDALLSIGTTTETTITKASTAAGTDVGLAGEANINKLTAFVFNGDAIVAVKEVTTNTTNDASVVNGKIIGVYGITVKAGTYDILLVANADVKSLSNKTAITNKVMELNTQTQTNLTMSSQLYEGVTVTGNTSTSDLTKNYLYSNGSVTTTENYTDGVTGNKIKLTRITARVQMNSLSIKFAGSYTGSTLKLSSIYLVNVTPESKLIGNTLANNPTVKYLCGTTAKVTVIDNLIYPTETYTTSLRKNYTGTSLADNTSKTFENDQLLQCYVFENKSIESTRPTIDSYNTRIVIKGEVVLSTGQSLGNRYYHITVKADGDKGYILPNYLYNVTATITGIGSPDEDGGSDGNADINAQISVLPWNVVNQNEGDLN